MHAGCNPILLKASSTDKYFNVNINLYIKPIIMFIIGYNNVIFKNKNHNFNGAMKSKSL